MSKERRPGNDTGCEDCNEEVLAPTRRRRCPACNLLLCPWCVGHTHRHAFEEARVAKRKVSAPEKPAVQP